VILNFFSSRCGPCNTEMSHLKAVQNEFGTKLTIISLSIRLSYDTDEILRQFRNDHDITWIVARDTANVRGKYDVPAIPTLYIIDQKGDIGYHHVGLTEASVIIEEVNELLTVTVSLTVTTSPSLQDVHFRVDGDDYYTSTGKFSVELEVGQHQVELVDTVVRESEDTEYRFSRWSGISSGSSNPKQIDITTSSALEAVFDKYCEIVFTQSGSGGTPHITVDGVSCKPPKTFWFAGGSSHSFSYETPVNGGAGIRYVLTSASHTSPIKATSPTTVTGNYETQYYVTVTSAHDSPTDSQWVDKGGSLTASVTSLADDDGAGTRHRCTGHKIDDGSLQSGTSYTFTNIQAPHKVEFQWIPQYRITVTESGLEAGRSITITINGTPHSGTTPFSYSEWHDKDFSFTFQLPDLIESATFGKRYALINWKNSKGSTVASPQTISGSEVFTAYYQMQYYLTVNTIPSVLNSQPDISPAGSWYDTGELVTCTAQVVNGYDFDHWVLDGALPEDGNIELTIAMDMAHNATARYTATTDFDLDGRVDEADISLIAGAFHSEIGEKDYDLRMDFDTNGVIDIVDVARVARDFEKTA